MSEKESFVKQMKIRTKRFSIDVIRFCNSLKSSKAASVINFQLLKSASSTGANYRAACKARSEKEFFSKLSIVVEEVDESEYWLEIIDGLELSLNKSELIRLLKEANELNRIVTSARATV